MISLEAKILKAIQTNKINLEILNDKT